MKRWKKVLIIVLASVVVLGGAAAAYFLFFRPDEQEATQQVEETAHYETTNKKIAESGTSKADLEKLVNEYGSEYEKSLNDVRELTPDKWTKTEVDKAHLSLLYADKVELYSQVQDLYRLISASKASGVDVDANSAGITQENRDEIKARADANMNMTYGTVEVPADGADQ